MAARVHGRRPGVEARVFRQRRWRQRGAAGGTVDDGRGARAVGLADRGGASAAAAAVVGNGATGATVAGRGLGAGLGPAGAADAATGGGTSGIHPPRRQLRCSAAGEDVEAPGDEADHHGQAGHAELEPEATVVGRLRLKRAGGNHGARRVEAGSSPAAVDAASGTGAVACGRGARVGARVDAIDGSAPSRAAHASQKRASTRLRWPHSGQAIVDDLALNIALHCA